MRRHHDMAALLLSYFFNAKAKSFLLQKHGVTEDLLKRKDRKDAEFLINLRVLTKKSFAAFALKNTLRLKIYALKNTLLFQTSR